VFIITTSETEMAAMSDVYDSQKVQALQAINQTLGRILMEIQQLKEAQQRIAAQAERQ
jgi:hypothetical protein